MRIYLDTSALVPVYVPEALTSRAVGRLAAPDTVYVSWLTHVEICSALSRKIRTGELEQAQARRVLEAFARHLESKAYEILPLGQEVHSLAAEWLATFATSLRALDSLHLACCRLFDLTLVTADEGLGQAADHFGVSWEHLAAPPG